MDSTGIGGISHDLNKMLAVIKHVVDRYTATQLVHQATSAWCTQWCAQHRSTAAVQNSRLPFSLYGPNRPELNSVEYKTEGNYSKENHPLTSFSIPVSNFVLREETFCLIYTGS